MAHTLDLPTSTAPRPAGLQAMSGLQCLTCIIERKTAEQDSPADGSLPEVRPAVTLLGTQLGPVTPLCYEHIVIQRHSPLTVPELAALPRLS